MIYLKILKNLRRLLKITLVFARFVYEWDDVLFTAIAEHHDRELRVAVGHMENFVIPGPTHLLILYE